MLGWFETCGVFQSHFRLPRQVNLKGGILRVGCLPGGFRVAATEDGDTSYTAKIPRDGARSLDKIISNNGGMRGFWVLMELAYGAERLL